MMKPLDSRPVLAGMLALAWLSGAILPAQEEPDEDEQVQGIARLRNGEIEIRPYPSEDAPEIVVDYPADDVAPRDVPVSFDKSIPRNDQAWKALRSPSCTLVKPLNQALEDLKTKAVLPENQDKLAEEIEKLNQASQRYDHSYNKAFLNPDLDEEDREKAKAEADIASKEFSAAANGILASLLDTADPELAAIENLIMLGRSLELEQKAVFGDLSNYDPKSYQEIYKNSLAVCEIWRTIGEKKGIGSGILIGERLILTANHVVLPYVDNEYLVRFHGNGGGAWGVEPTIFKVKERLLSDERLDFALLLLDSDQKGDAFLDKIERPVISSRRVQPEESLYVVGFPNVKGPPKVVHDACFAIFPYSATKIQVSDILRRVISYEMYHAVSGQTLQTIDKLDKGKLKDVILTQVKNCMGAYGYAEDAPANKLFSYIPLDGLNKNTPVLGLDSDTFKGDSGGGVFVKAADSQPLVALFLNGQPDDAPAYQRTWSFHEKARPISPIAKILSDKGLESTYKIKITDQ